MVRYRRHPVPGGCLFFTAALADRRACFLTEHVGVLRAAFRAVRAERPFSIDAIVVLPDHLHAVWTLPAGDADFAERWRRTKSRFTRGVLADGVALAARDGTGRVLWQRRFWEHTIRDDADFRAHVEYVHFNPVRHGLVDRAEDWPHSSLHRFVRAGVVPRGWGGDGGVAHGGFGEP